MAILKRVTGDAAGQIIELKSELTVIGRSPECQIVLDPNGVSRRHAEIRKVGDAFFLADLRSRNKTKVNNAEVEPGQRPPAPAGRPDQHLRRRVRLLPRRPPRRPAPKADGDVMVVTEGEDVRRPEHAHARRLALERPGQRRPARGQAQGDPRDRPEPLERAAGSTPSPPRSSTR